MISGFGIAIAQHRYFTHRSFETYRFIHYLLGWLACMGSQGSPIFWTATHLHHHKTSDRETDPHSPKDGWWHAYWGWIIDLNAKDVPMTYCKHLIRDPFHKWMHKNYYKIVWGSVLIIAILDLIFTNSLYITLFGLILPMMWSTHQEPLTNIFGHLPKFGYRNFNTKDNSTNSRILGLLTFGQCYHNNHHARPQQYNFGTNWTEFDPAVPLIEIIKKR